MDPDHIKCPVCFETYESQNHVPMVMRCGHTICRPCLRLLFNQPEARCPTCREKCKAIASVRQNFAFAESLNATQLVFEKINKELTTVKTEKSILEQKVEKDSEILKKYEIEKCTDDKSSCSECENIDWDKNLNVCDNCSSAKFKMDFKNPDIFPIEFEVEKVAICSTCAIRKHVKHNHRILEYLPILIHQHYKDHKGNLKFLRDDLDKSIEGYYDSVRESNGIVTAAKKVLDEMTEGIKKCEKTTEQNVVVAKIEGKIQVINNFVYDHAATTRKLREEFMTEWGEEERLFTVENAECSGEMVASKKMKLEEGMEEDHNAQGCSSSVLSNSPVNCETMDQGGVKRKNAKGPTTRSKNNIIKPKYRLANGSEHDDE